MRRRRYKSPLAEAEINLTPLIDICFVILIMFIVVAPLLEIERIELAQGPCHEGKTTLPVQKQSSIIIQAFKDNTLTLNKKPLNLQDLRAQLPQLKKMYPNAKPQLFQDQKASFGLYQNVKNALEAAGFSEMELVLKP